MNAKSRGLQHKRSPSPRNASSGDFGTVRSRYKRQLIRLNMKKKWPTRTEMEDSRPIFFCKRFSYNENALYCCLPNFGRYSRSQDRVWFNCPLVDPFCSAEWMAETLLRTVDRPSCHRRDRPKLGRQQYMPANALGQLRHSQWLQSSSFAPIAGQCTWKGPGHVSPVTPKLSSLAPISATWSLQQPSWPPVYELLLHLHASHFTPPCSPCT